MHRVWKHLCLARRRDAWYALGRQRDSSPAGADVLAPTCVGVFFMAGYTGHKKDPISFEAGLAPSSSPAALYPLPCRIFSMGETKQFCPVAPAIKKAHLIRGGPPPSSSPVALYHLCFHHNRRTDSKKSTLPRQSALRLGCSVLAGWCRIRQPSSPWPALRSPCCPR